MGEDAAIKSPSPADDDGVNEMLVVVTWTSRSMATRE
jgi:hypothetical protein